MKKLKQMEIFLGNKNHTVGDSPVGLLLLDDGSIICKSEYFIKNNPKCIIISSGEFYCGDFKSNCKSIIIN